MRTRFIAVAAVLFATSAFADDRFTIFVSDLGHQTGRTTTTFESGGVATPVTKERSEWTGSAGVAFSHSWSERWSTEGSIAYDQRYITGTKFVGGVPATSRQRISTTPVDLMMRLHFPTESRWNPYVGAGAHYVNAPGIERATLNVVPGPGGAIPVTLEGYDDRFSAQVGVGTTFRITPRVGLQFDLKRLLRSEGAAYDPLTRASFGVNWRL